MDDKRILLSEENLPKLVQEIKIEMVIKTIFTSLPAETPESRLGNICGEFIQQSAEWEDIIPRLLSRNIDIAWQLIAVAPYIFKRCRLDRKIFSELMSELQSLLIKQNIHDPNPKKYLDMFTGILLGLICLPENYVDTNLQYKMLTAAKEGNIEEFFFTCQAEYDACFNKESGPLDVRCQLIRNDYDDSRNTLKAAEKYILEAAYETSAFWDDEVVTIHPYPIISICQRSGTGKTRLMIELGRRIFLSVYMSLSGFTKSPDKLISFIHNLACNEVDRNTKVLHAKALILSILDYVHGKLRESELASSPRTVENTKAFSELLDSIIYPFLPSTFKDDPSQCISIWAHILSNCNDEKTAESLLVKWKSGYYKGTRNFPLVMISIDEARSLLVKIGHEVSPFQIIRQAAFELGLQRPEKRDFVIIFADTTFKIANSAPNKDNDLYPPFYTIPTHDLKAGSYLEKAREASTNDLNREQNWAEFLEQRENSDNDWGMNRLGSPLWEAYLSNFPDEKLFEFAREKLAPTTLPIAALASRISLAISPSSQLASDLVAHSMAHLDLVSEDCSRTHVSYPSDPVLAAGGALYCKGNGDTVLQSVYEKIHSSELDGGNVGELVGQVLLLSAMDRCEGLPLMSVSALDFLRRLFPTISKLAETPFIESDIAKGKLFFNHFIQVDKTIARKEIRMALIRGAAIVGKRNQEAVDVFIPVCLKDGRLSCIIVQFKNHKASISPTVSDHLFTAMDKYAVKICDGVSTVKILFNLKQGLAHYGQSAIVDGNGARIISEGLQFTGHSYWSPAKESFEALLRILKLSQSLSKISELEFTPLLKDFFTFTENPAHLYGDELFCEY